MGLCGLDIVTTNICCNVEACIGSQNFSPIDQSYKSVVMWRLVSAVKIFHPSTNPISLKIYSKRNPFQKEILVNLLLFTHSRVVFFCKSKEENNQYLSIINQSANK
jgi:hypothetical protein